MHTHLVHNILLTKLNDFHFLIMNPKISLQLISIIEIIQLFKCSSFYLFFLFLLRSTTKNIKYLIIKYGDIYERY